MALYLDREQQPLLASAAPRVPLTAIVISSAGGLRNASWASTAQLGMRVRLSGDTGPMVSLPEVEIMPLGVPFTDLPNVAGSWLRVAAHGSASAHFSLPGIRNGHWYHWQVRTRGAAGGTSRWIAGGSFGIDATPPTTPAMIRANAANGSLTNVRTISLHWAPSLDRAGITRYEWATSQNPYAPPTWHASTTRVLHLHTLGDGTWQISIRARDRAGNASVPLHWTVHIDRAAPRMSDLTLSARRLTPEARLIHVRFSLAQAAHVDLAVFRLGSAIPVTQMLPGILGAGTHDLQWAGTDSKGHALVSGHYQPRIGIRDEAGNVTWKSLPSITIDFKRIIISLRHQDLTAYDGSRSLLHTLITSGGPETRTPIGIYHIMAKFAPMIMHSPWPRTSPLWYPDSPVNFALLFQTGGYFLHDAPWRTTYGPGSNLVEGIPGGNTTGTHGCVNVPYTAEHWLYAWTTVGTTVQILP